MKRAQRSSFAHTHIRTRARGDNRAKAPPPLVVPPACRIKAADLMLSSAARDPLPGRPAGEQVGWQRRLNGAAAARRPAKSAAEAQAGAAAGGNQVSSSPPAATGGGAAATLPSPGRYRAMDGDLLKNWKMEESSSIFMFYQPLERYQSKMVQLHFSARTV